MLSAKRNYCVYKHYDVFGDLFYIGSGQDKRPYSSDSRSDEWFEKVLINGTMSWRIEIVARNLTKEESLTIEDGIIRDIGLHNLVNKSYVENNAAVRLERVLAASQAKVEPQAPVIVDADGQFSMW